MRKFRWVVGGGGGGATKHAAMVLCNFTPSEYNFAWSFQSRIDVDKEILPFHQTQLTFGTLWHAQSWKVYKDASFTAIFSLSVLRNARSLDFARQSRNQTRSRRDLSRPRIDVHCCYVEQVQSRPRPLPDPRAPRALAESKQRQQSISLFLLRSLLCLYLFHA